MQGYRHGALTVIETPSSKDSINRQLKALDPRLFLERQLTLTQEAVWCVCIELQGAPPYTVLEWRDDEGRPLEPSSGLVERMARMVAQGDATALGKEAARKNQEKIDKEREERFETMREMALDYQRMLLRGGHAGPLAPRGQSLRRSRDRMRARGFNV